MNLTEQGILIATGSLPQKLIDAAKTVTYTPSDLCKKLPAPYELFEVPCVRTSAERAWMSIPGTVEYIENITEFTDKAVFDVLPRATVSIGCKVNFPRNNVEKCGNIIAVSHDRNMAIKAAEDAVSNVFITLKPSTKETDDYLNCVTQSDEENFPPDAFGRLNESQLAKLDGVIAADSPVSAALPDFLNTDEYSQLTDWNFNTISQTLNKFDILRAKHPELNKKDFFKALMRGGIQGAVYYSDTCKAGKK